VTTGYTPFVNFTVEDLDSTMMRLVLQGASLDGPVKYPLHGKVNQTLSARFLQEEKG